MTLKYALVVEDRIVKIRNVPDDDDLLIGKLERHNYLIVIEATPPDIDSVTQSLSETYKIQEESVVRKWTVEERPFEIAKQMKEGELESKTLDNIDDELESDTQEADVAATLVRRNQFAALIKVATTNEELREIIIEM